MMDFADPLNPNELAAPAQRTSAKRLSSAALLMTFWSLIPSFREKHRTTSSSIFDFTRELPSRQALRGQLG